MQIDRIVRYFHAKTRPQREVIEVAPFTLYLHLTSQDLENSVALLNSAPGDDLQRALPRLEQIFANRERRPSIQWIDCQAPTLADDLLNAGYTVGERQPVLFCLPEQINPPHNAPLLEYVVLSAESSLEEVEEGWNVNARGFDPDSALGTPDEIEEFRRSLAHCRAFTARLDGIGVGAGMFIDLHEGVTELMGIATLKPFRRRGIASALTAYMTNYTFNFGASLTFLVAASPIASRVYRRIGYQVCGYLMSATRDDRTQMTQMHADFRRSERIYHGHEYGWP
ncbi:MAG: GNAT family N-acetyltransferase [Caldilineaceae bacterium]|nr:GNAT family N-acetyltransferase [Caldilineaceae bacterium]